MTNKEIQLKTWAEELGLSRQETFETPEVSEKMAVDIFMRQTPEYKFRYLRQQ